MKINKLLFLKILAKHCAAKIGFKDCSESDLNMLAQSLSPIFNNYASTLKSRYILDDENQIDILLLEKNVEAVFTLIPVLKFPIQAFSFSISAYDAKKFIEDLKQHCNVNEVICLPCQS